MSLPQLAPALHALPSQHAWPSAPHSAQLPATHVDPAAQRSPAQHGPPAAPHGSHVPALHASVESEHDPAPQHGWLLPPQAVQ
jgi:hypothetical protein